jgi:3-deoxy-D-manno-octulosonic-acid transferase
LATHFFLFQTAHGFISAKKLIFCRYDFFPELLILKFFGKKLILVNGAAGKKPSWFKSQVYKLFDVIVAANQSERQIFIEREEIEAKKVLSFDFRIPRIFERAKGAEALLSSIAPLQSYFEFLRNRPKNSLLILGSAWESDLIIFSSPEWREPIGRGEIHLLVVPHDLSKTTLGSLRTHLEALFPKVPVCEISDSVNEFNPECPGIVLLNWRGILCELYTLSDLVYIGGGFARSIHSVLEPFLSGAKVFCGPKIHRSSEYDFVVEAKASEIQLLKNGDSFYTLFKEKAATPPDQTLRLDLGRTSADVMKAVLTEIEQC